MNLGNLKHDNKLICPYEKKSFIAFQANFWLDEDNKWHLDCPICQTEHYISNIKVISESKNKKSKYINGEKLSDAIRSLRDER